MDSTWLILSVTNAHKDASSVHQESSVMFALQRLISLTECVSEAAQLAHTLMVMSASHVLMLVKSVPLETISTAPSVT